MGEVHVKAALLSALLLTACASARDGLFATDSTAERLKAEARASADAERQSHQEAEAQAAWDAAHPCQSMCNRFTVMCVGQLRSSADAVVCDKNRRECETYCAQKGQP